MSRVKGVLVEDLKLLAIAGHVPQKLLINLAQNKAEVLI